MGAERLAIKTMSTMSVPDVVAPVMREIDAGMELKKCRKCGCMLDALNQAARVFATSEQPELLRLAGDIERQKTRMEPIAYDCLGCRKCWGADATIQLAERFEDVELDTCGVSAADAPVQRTANAAEKTWPPHAGDYVVGNPAGSVAVCTLSNRELPAQIVAAGQPHVAIAGRCDTENIGVEKVVLNTVTNPHIRWLILCGNEARGHRAGDAFLQLKEKGVDSKMRVLESASWRPILKNLTLLDVARFRSQVEVVNLIGSSDLEAVLSAVQRCASTNVAPLPAYSADSTRLQAKKIGAAAPAQLKLDRAGFFIVVPQPQAGLIVCEHYENSGRLAHVIEGRSAALIASTVVERGLVTQLDHAAYLGRELCKAEIAMKTGAAYEQDAALGELSDREIKAARESEHNGSCNRSGCCS